MRRGHPEPGLPVARARGEPLWPRDNLLLAVLQDLRALEPLRSAQEGTPEAEAATVSLPVMWKGEKAPTDIVLYTLV